MAARWAATVPASGITGTIADDRLPATVVRTTGNQMITGTLTATGFAGSGAGLTNLPAAALSGTVPSGAVSFAGTLSAGGFSGSGAGLTNLPASALTGTVPDAALPGNLARTDAAASFTGSVQVGGASDACANASHYGRIRWTGSAFQGCTPAGWTSLSRLYGSCAEHYAAGSRTDGVYQVTLLGLNYDVWCDMTGGGWTLVMRGFGGSQFGDNWNVTGAIGAAVAPSPTSTASFKLHDDLINALAGSSGKFRLSSNATANPPDPQPPTLYVPGTCTYAHTAAAAGDCLKFSTS